LISRGTELMAYRGDFEDPSHWSEWVEYPFHPGYGLVGTVSEIGREVRTVQLGDRVAVNAPHASECVVGEDRLYLVPPDVAAEDAVWFALCSIALQGVRRADLRLGMNVLVFGAGPLGSLLGRWSILAGARAVVAVGLRNDRRAWASDRFPIHYVTLESFDSFEQALRDTGTEKFQVAIDATASDHGLLQCGRAVDDGGRVVAVGDPGFPSQRVAPALLLPKELEVVGAHEDGISRSPDHWSGYRQNVEFFFDCVRTGRIAVRDLTTAFYPFRDAPAAYSAMSAGDQRETGGILIHWDL
jgi:threonine dehydrogenase-like Zn-dependent dehydrogenase